MRVARVAAQAKINLFLHVGPRQPSGYHEIFTLFQLLELADDVVVRVGGDKRSVDVAGPHLPEGGLGPPEKNLAFRAAVEYVNRTGRPRGFSIELTKNVPAGGGLGGGSSDAGAVLRALDALSEHPLDAEALSDLAASVGSDVPFFVSNLPNALGHGRGERLAGVEPLPSRAVALACPSFGISTADAYRWLDDDGGSTWTPMELPADHTVSGVLGIGDWKGIRLKAHNDFEPPVERRHPALKRIRERLGESGAMVARLSGSGSTVFGIFEGSVPTAADLALDALVIPTRTSARVVQVEVLE